MTTADTHLAKSYQPAEAEGEVRRRWQDQAAFHVEPDAGQGQAYCIVIPPPNVTAALHLGHAFNNTLQDILIRHHRMRGFQTLWMPGTDHAGIATQTVVEKRLKEQEGQRRSDFTREQFVARVQAWKDEYEATITEQLQAMGCSCDWARQRFTMDSMCAKAVREAFYRLFCEDLIYRGKRLVNWDPVTLTALADDEVEMVEVPGHMWYLRYPLEPDPQAPPTDQPYVVVATTRPETMLGDTAVAINPRDPRAASLRGRSVRLPIVNRLIPIIEDDYVVLPKAMGGDPSDAKSEYATGFLKVTPAHDPNDWEIGLRHELTAINVMAPDASISAENGWPAEEFESGAAEMAKSYIGLSREEARKQIVAWFKDQGLLDNVRDYSHSVGHSYRSHVPIEPYLSDQWYVRVTDDRLAGEALRAMDEKQHEGAAPPRQQGGTLEGDGGLTFFPTRYAKMYQSWHENLRDWCISRQIWWGHQIPVWRHETLPAEATQQVEAWQGQQRLRSRRDDRGVWWICIREEDDQEVIDYLEQAGCKRDADVLDTWFSSALWPISTMGWPDPSAFPETNGLLETFNPSSVLCTGRDIITLWVSRMVMFNRFFREGTLPFRHVYIHPMIQDGHGQRMSKSLGNGVDPRDIIHGHGTDAMRFVLCQMATSTQDARLPVDMICPHCQKTFHPSEITSSTGHRVAAPEPVCPACQGKMVSGYGAASGKATPSDAIPTARNTSSKFDEGRNFANKLWNATRFALSRLEGTSDATDSIDTANCSLVDRWIISRLHNTLHAVEDAIGSYQFNVYADSLYDFVWGDFCDWYLEAVKPTVADDAAQRQVLRTVLNAILRLLHPVCPFVTETLWPHVRSSGPAGLQGIGLPDASMLCQSAWPDIKCSIHDHGAIEQFQRIQELIEAIRTLRGSHNVPPKRRIKLHVTADVATLLEPASQAVHALAGLESIETQSGPAPSGAIPVAFEGGELLLSGLADTVDLDAERTRLGKLIQDKQNAVNGFEKKLGNANYVDKAPAAVVEETRKRLSDAQADLAAAEQALARLGA